MTQVSSLVLEAQLREERGKKAKLLRDKGMIPAVLYGHGVKNVNLMVDARVFEKIYKQAGSSSLVDLQVAGQKPTKILIQEVQYDPTGGRVLHVDFHQVKMTEKIHAEVEINFIGESKAVKELGGILVKNISSLEIECLPQDLIHEFKVDISVLENFEQMIRIKDLKLPATITIKENDDEVVASVQPPRSEEELKSLEEKVEEKVEDVAKVEKKKKEEEEETSASPAPAEPAKEEKK